MELMQEQIGDLIYDGETWGLIKEIKCGDISTLYIVEWYARREIVIYTYTGSYIMNWRKKAVDSGPER